MAVALEPLGQTHLDEEVESAEHGGAAQMGVLAPQVVEEFDGTNRTARITQRLGHELPLCRQPARGAAGCV